MYIRCVELSGTNCPALNCPSQIVMPRIVREPPRGVLIRSPVPAKEKCLKTLAERRHVVPWQQAQCKRESIPSGGANNIESSTLFKRRAGPRNQELTTSRETKGSAGS